LRTILNPIKKSIKVLEYRNTTLTDCFIQLINLLGAIEQLSGLTNNQFQKECLLILNKRWNQFDFDLYLLTYFFHPKYRCKYNI